MKLQSGLNLLMASAVAVCCVLPANAQPVVTEVTGVVQSFDGGWHNSSDIGKPVTFDFVYDASAVTTTVTSTSYTLFAPITSADLVGGIFGSGINLEPDGPGKGKIVDTLNLNTGVVTLSALTSLKPPTPGFTGDVYGFNFESNGTSTDLDLIRDVYSHGHLDRKDSGAADLSVVSVEQVQAPEIDPTSAISALTLLIGGLAVIRGRKLAGLPSA